MTQTFDTLDKLRVQVQQPWPGLPNLIANPAGGDEGTSGWLYPDLAATPAALRFTRVAGATGARYLRVPITPTPAGYRARAQMRRLGGTAGAAIRMRIVSYDGSTIANGPQSASTSANGGVVSTSFDLGEGETHVWVELDLASMGVGQYVDVSDVVLIVGPLAEANASPLTPTQVWYDVTGPGTNLQIDRDELQVGTVTFNAADSALDPANSDVIRPGRDVRAQALIAGSWRHLSAAKLLNGRVSYDLKTTSTPDEKRSRVTFTATDAVTVLANTPRPEGVATIDELPYLLDGTEVPYVVNGRSSSIDPTTVTVVSRNDNASAVDQVGITRDSQLGYAWVSRAGVLNVWDADTIPSAPVDLLDESVYTDLQVDYDTDRCINTVTVKLLTPDPETGDTQESTFGPYVDAESVRVWGAHRAEFTVHGLDETDVPAYAASILAANGTPQRRIQSVTIKLRSVAELEAHGLRDLYDLVTVSNERAGIEEQLRIVTLSHQVTPDSWQLVLGFAADNSIAPPSTTPAIPTPAGSTIAERLRPIGEGTLWYGDKAQCPAGWLVCDGSAFSAATYPKLAAFLGGTLLPNNADRTIVGASAARPVRSAAGTEDRTIAAHSHSVPGHAHAAGTLTTNTFNDRANGTLSRAGAAISGSTATGGAGTSGAGGAATFDVVQPYRAWHVIIRAV